MAIRKITPNTQDAPQLGQSEAVFENNASHMFGDYMPQFVDELNLTTTDIDDAVDIIDLMLQSGTPANQLTGLVGNLTSPLLDIDFQNGINMKSGSGSVTFSRDSKATYIDRYNVLQYASIDKPRYNKDGLLVELESTNLVRYSNNLSIPAMGWFSNHTGGNSAIVTENYGISPDGTTNSNRVLLTEVDKILRHTTNTTINGQTVTISFSCKGTQGEVLRSRMYGDVDTVDTPLTGDWQDVVVTVLKTSDYIDIIRSEVGFATDVEFFEVQIETLPFDTSRIHTESIPVTRSKDAISLDRSNNFPLWSDPFSVHCVFTVPPIGGNNNMIFSTGDTANGFLNNTSIGDISFNVLGNSIKYSLSDRVAEQVSVVVVSDSVNISLYIDGVFLASGLVGSNTEVFSETITLFSSGVANSDMNKSNVKILKIYDKALTSTEIKML